MSATISSTSLCAHDVEALLEDHLALIVQHVVEFQQVLADFEVARLDLLLRLLERLVDPGMGDGLALFADPSRCRIESMRLGAEDPHQIVLQAEEEFRGAGIALTARTAAQLIVDAPAFVALGAQDEEAAGRDHALLVFGDLGADLRDAARSSRLRR